MLNLFERLLPGYRNLLKLPIGGLAFYIDRLAGGGADFSFSTVEVKKMKEGHPAALSMLEHYGEVVIENDAVELHTADLVTSTLAYGLLVDHFRLSEETTGN